MKKKISIKKNIIKFDSKSLWYDITEILWKRFDSLDDLDKNLDDLHDPYLLIDMDKAVNRIKIAKYNDQKVIIFWDYDVDGVTSTSILMHFFKKIWLKSSYRLPHRVKDWYWLKNYFIDELKELWVDLIVTVDCGTRDTEVIKYAKQNGIDIIVTDHHSVPDFIPKEAIAVINPKREDCNYPFKNLAWAWVAYKLMMALAREYFDEQEYYKYLWESIDIAAIWTVADCMSLTWENRIIVSEWLKQIKNSRSNGIRALIEDKIHTDLDADIFGFVIWPKLNAAGRMDSPYKAVNLILNNWESLNKTLAEIEGLNEKRKFLTKQFVDEALVTVNKKDNMLFYYSTAIDHWIIWIVAWRLTEQFYKPSIVLKDEWDKLVASCRSPEYFSIVDILEKHKEYFIAFWGHKWAAWFSIKREKFWEFKTRILQELNSMDFSNHKKELLVDKVINLNELWFWFFKKITRFVPFWIWNKKPLFIVENLDYESVSILWNKSRDHIRFKTKHWYKIFWFGLWEYLEQIKKAKKVDIIFDISEDFWMGKRNLMLKVIDVVLE